MLAAFATTTAAGGGDVAVGDDNDVAEDILAATVDGDVAAAAVEVVADVVEDGFINLTDIDNSATVAAAVTEAGVDAAVGD